MRELTAARPPAAFSTRTAAVVRERLGAAVPAMIEAIERGEPDYADPDRPDYQRRLAGAVMRAVTEFFGQLSDPGASTGLVTDEFRAIGFTAAREGRTLDALQNALRLGTRIAWRGLCQAELDTGELSRVGEAVFAYLDELADACARGYEEAGAQVAVEQERNRRRLIDVLVADPPPSPELVASLASAAGWVLPSRIAVAVLGDRPARPRPSAASLALPTALPALPPDVLAVWDCPEPCLIVPDPDGPGRAAAIDQALGAWPGAIGPAVPLARAAWSLRWARQALAHARRGVIEGGLVRCDQHLSTLLILADEELAQELCAACLGPLTRVRSGQRDRLAETMLAWLQLGESVTRAAERMHVHPQTVRYRLRQIHELFGDRLRDPDHRFELQVALRVRALLASDAT